LEVTPTIRVSVVVPVYSGEKTLEALVSELERLTRPFRTPAGRLFEIGEVLLVHDCGRDRSDLVMEALAARHAFVKTVWLSRNFGQHPATLAGMSSASGEWVVTMDEDGQQDPACIPDMLDVALGEALQVVYASPRNPPPHGLLRNAGSHFAKTVSTRVMGNSTIGRFNSFRLVDGETARTLAAYCGTGVYLDVALCWIAGRIGYCPVELREEMDRPSGYSFRKLLSHFWRLVMTAGTRPLRIITVVGFLSIVLAMLLTGYALYAKLTGQAGVQGWASLLIVVSFFSGAILTALGVIAEYLALTMGIAMGKPLYVISSKPTRPGPRA